MIRFRLSRRVTLAVVSSFLLSLIPLSASASSDDPDLTVVTEIRQEGFRHSQVMDILEELTDRIGPRLTGSPNVKRANEWTRDKLTSFGLVNAHLESWGPFGRGWSNEFTSVRMLAPDVTMLYAIPKAWTPSTKGVVKSDVVLMKVESKEDLDKYRGKVAGKIVLLGAPPELKPREEALMERYDQKKLQDIQSYSVNDRFQALIARYMKQRELAKDIAKFLEDEKVAAEIESSRGEDGTLFVQGTQAYKKGESAGVPDLIMETEQYGRLARLVEHNVPVELELNVQNKFYDDDPMQYNTIAEIPGTDKRDEVVMLGAHLDSWHAGTGATDNGAGVAVIMEAARILKALDLKPRRTVRVALWTGEEEGLLGSRAYCDQHFGVREKLEMASEKDMPDFLKPDGKLVVKPEQAKLAAYFNIDNGTGKLRGIYAQENAAVVPIFQKWLAPFADIGATTVTMRNTSGTDHLSFDRVDLPGFQFIQDPIEYETLTHHSNMDVFERAQKEDLQQAAVILASFVYNAAMRDEELPRKPMLPETPAPLKTNVASNAAASSTGK